MAVWRILPLQQRRQDLPLIYVKHDLSNRGYTLMITDLVNIWAELLEWRAVVKRSLNDATSVDLLEADQHSVFIDRLTAALLGEAGTSIALQPVGTGKELVLQTTTPLEAPFKPLVWRFHLSPGSSDSLAQELTVPTLLSLQRGRDDSAELVTRLQEKDRVIEKMRGKLQGIGVALDDVFPNVVPGVRGAKLAKNDDLFNKYVKGLAAFDPQAFTKQRGLSGPSKASQRSSTILRDGLDCTHCPSWTPPGAWWDDLAAGSASQNLSMVPDSQPKTASLTRGESTDDFNTQDDRKDIADRSRPIQKGKHDDATKMSSKAAPVSRPSSSLNGAAPMQSAKQGALTHGKPGPSGPTRPERNGAPKTDDDASTIKGSADEKAKRPRVPESGVDSEPMPPSAPKRLGRLGGKRKPLPGPATSSAIAGDARPTNDSQTASPEVISQGGEPPLARTAPSRARGRLGRIGGARAPPVIPHPSDNASATAPASFGLVGATQGGHSPDNLNNEAIKAEANAVAAKEENAEERAARNRAETKRQLEAKSKAPAKKKRKF